MAVSKILSTALTNPVLRQAILSSAQKYIRYNFSRSRLHTRQIRMAQYQAIFNLLLAIDRGFRERLISPPVRDRLLKNLVGRVIYRNRNVLKAFENEFHTGPPGFMVISPEGRCNLHCAGCYAASSADISAHLSFAVVDRVLSEKEKLWDSYFTVISGGEPLLWQDGGKTVLDLFERHIDNYFLMFTNGTLINRTVAEKLSRLGNVTPAISVEGFEPETDRRRGKGIFAKVLLAMAYLRDAGVPFGISVTATRENAELVVSEEFVDFFFNQEKALYGWLFQYMPIGRAPTLKLMVTPEQRKMLLERELELVFQHKLFFMDFWNGGIFSSGCIAGGRSGGYLYLDWNGNITPCVFIPYAVANINEIYRRGGSINEVLNSKLFKKIRAFQYDYGYTRTGKVGNWFAPCFIRDHHQLAHQTLKETDALPIDNGAKAALTDLNYYQGLCEYNVRFRELTDKFWQQEFLRD
ncbi:MAG: radical SAM/SPASM domain-containing protein [candidate division WOR-3 bacterium]|jgi:MoaA/NifB/PqqE/SkfB family radical SAM enzyme